MTRKTYSVEFKQQAVQLALSGEKSKAQTTRDIEITADWSIDSGRLVMK